MNAQELGTYLREYRARTAETRRATFDEAIDDRRCWVILDDTKGRVTATRGAIAGQFTKGQSLTLTRLNGAGRSRATEYIVTDLGGSSADGLAGSTPVSDAVTRTAATVIKMPTSVALTKGGAAVSILIYGVGFTAAPAYGDPGITNNVAPVVAAELIALQVKASGAVAAGRYSITLGGVTTPNFFIVT